MNDFSLSNLQYNFKNSLIISNFVYIYKTNFLITIFLKYFSSAGSLLLIVLLFLSAPDIKAQDSLLTFEHPNEPPDLQELLKWKEVLTYEVKYGPFTLGDIKTEIISDTTFQGQKVWWLQTQIISNPSIPFVGDEENHYNTLFVETDSLPYTVLYWRDNIDEKEYNDERYQFDYKKEKVYITEQARPVDTLEVTEPSTSGQLIFITGRLFAGINSSFRLPVYIEREKGYIDARYTDKAEEREYKAFDNPVKTYYSEGDANLDGPFGFSGQYKAWYIADDLRIPAETHAKVWLGDVKVRITNYKKVPRNQ